MRIGVDYGLEHVDLEIPENRLIALERSRPAAALPDPGAALREALEHPTDFPALRRALTPDDHLAIVLDDDLPQPAELLTALVDHLATAHVGPDALRLVCLQDRDRPWWGDLPAPLQNIPIEIHDPTDRKRLSYLATTKKGRRIYLNRTVVDADQTIVLSRRTWDPLVGHGGGECALFPALCDEATRHELWTELSFAAPGSKPWPLQQEAIEVAWLLGAPFFIQVIEDGNGGVQQLVTGLVETSAAGMRAHQNRWRVAVPEAADIVLATFSPERDRPSFSELAQALANASRVVKPTGQVILLTPAAPELTEAAEFLQRADSPATALKRLRRDQPNDVPSAFLWANAAQRAKVYLLSGLDDEVAENLFAIPLEHAGQVQRLLGNGQSCLILPEANRTLAVVQRQESEE